MKAFLFALSVASAYLVWRFQRSFSLPNIKSSHDLLESYDYIIVGAGTAGAALAARLALGSDASVLLIEAGGTGIEAPYNIIPGFMSTTWRSPIDWAYQTVPQKHASQGHVDKKGNWPRGKVLGGSSVINAMKHSRARKLDHKRWEEKHGCKGWGWKDVLPYYRRMEAITFKSNHPEERGTEGPIKVTVVPPSQAGEIFLKAASEYGHHVTDEQNGADHEGWARCEQAIFNGKRQSSWNYLELAANRPNFHILTYALATKVLFDEKKTAVGMEVEVNGQLHTIKASKEVVLTGGALGSPHLLMLSGIGPKEQLEKFGIPVLLHNPHVGQHMEDHIMTGWPVFRVNATGLGFKRASFYSLTTLTRALQYALFGTGLWAQVGTELNGLIHSGVQPPTDAPDVQLQFASFYFQDGVGHSKQNLRPDVEAAETGADTGAEWLVTVTSGLQRPLSTGELRLQSADPRVPPLFDPKHLSNPRDLDAITTGLEMVLGIVQNTSAFSALGPVSTELPVPDCKQHKMWSRKYLECFSRAKTLTIYHPSCTCRMGPDPKTAVVDPKLRVYGVKGLRIADASVFPDIPSTNTNVAALLVGEKAADIILNDQ